MGVVMQPRATRPERYSALKRQGHNYRHPPCADHAQLLTRRRPPSAGVFARDASLDAIEI